MTCSILPFKGVEAEEVEAAELGEGSYLVEILGRYHHLEIELLNGDAMGLRSIYNRFPLPLPDL